MSDASKPYYPHDKDDHVEVELTIKVRIGVSEKLPMSSQVLMFAKSVKKSVEDTGARTLFDGYTITKEDPWCGSKREKLQYDAQFECHNQYGGRDDY